MKRLLLFLLLLALGFTVLRLSLGDDPVATAGTSPGTAPAPGEPSPPRPSGRDPIEMQRGSLAIGLEVRGAMQLEQTRLVETPAGTERQTIYTLQCADCAPSPGGGHLLQDVTMRLFERGRPQADLTARSALLELAIDENGRRSVREDKEIDLLDMTLQTLPGARHGPLRFSAERVRMLVEESRISLHTPEASQLVTVTIGGDRPGMLRGRGLQARLPRGADSPLSRIDVQILSQPELVAEGIRVDADGSLYYVEDVRTGMAMLTADQNVRAALDGSGTGGSRSLGRGTGTVTMRGDQLQAALQRHRSTGPDGDSRDTIDWTQFRLIGSRAHVEGDGLEIDSPRFTVHSGPRGEPLLVTADSGTSDLLQRGADGGILARFHSARPIRMVRPAQWLLSSLGPFGFDQGAFGSLQQLEVLIFEGAADLDAGDDVRLLADRGLRVYRLEPARDDGAIVARGAGNVTIMQGRSDDRTVAIGDNGFLLQRTATGEVLRMGVDDPASLQHFELQQGELRLSGDGNCRIERLSDGSTVLRLASTRPSIEGSFGAAIGEIKDATSLDATLTGRRLLSFTTSGPRVHLELRRGKLQLAVDAQRIEQFADGAFRLLADAPDLVRVVHPASRRLPAGELLAPVVDVYQLGADEFVVEARASADHRASLSTSLATARGRDPGTFDSTAGRIRMLPFAVPAGALRPHLFGLSPGVADVVAHTIARGWVIADDEVVAEFVAPEQGSTHAVGTALIVSQGTRSGLLVGDAATDRFATVRSRQSDGRIAIAEGPRARFYFSEGERFSVLPTFPGRPSLRPPVVVLRNERPADANDPLANLRGTCDGEIEVLPHAVLFHGPVYARGLRPDGSEDPEGLRIIADQLALARQRDTARIVGATAVGGTTVEWGRLRAQSHAIDLDLRRQRCLLEDEAGASLVLGDGLRYTAHRIEANYVTYSVRCWRGRVEQRPVGLP